MCWLFSLGLSARKADKKSVPCIAANLILDQPESHQCASGIKQKMNELLLAIQFPDYKFAKKLEKLTVQVESIQLPCLRVLLSSSKQMTTALYLVCLGGWPFFIVQKKAKFYWKLPTDNSYIFSLVQNAKCPLVR